MQTKYSYWLFKDAISSIDRRKIKKIASDSKYTDATTKASHAVGGEKNLKLRDTRVAFSDKEYLYDLLCPYVHGANKNAGWNFDIDWFEPVQIAKYVKNQHYSWHTDGSSDVHGSYAEGENFKGKIRKLSLVGMISNGYTGGELELALQSQDEENEILNPNMMVGDVIVFPSFLFHRSTAITKGVKHSVAMWCLGPPFK